MIDGNILTHKRFLSSNPVATFPESSGDNVGCVLVTDDASVVSDPSRLILVASG